MDKAQEQEYLMLYLKECIEKMNQITEQLDASQLTVEMNAFDVINSSDISLNLVKDGIKSIDELLNKIGVLNTVVENSSSKISRMENFSQMIAGFAIVSSKISNMTNKLSLNASIEAARAGEQGCGFASIVEEVRELASQSEQSSNEMAQTIESIQISIAETVEAMNSIYAIVEQQNAMVNDIKTVLHKILEAAYVSNDVSRNVEHEVAYQRDITENIKKAISALSEELNKHKLP